MSRAYLLLDSCQIENLNARLFERAPGAAPHALYLMTQYAELAAYGPVLIAVETGSPLVQAFVQQWQYSAGIWIESDADEAQLVAHLRSLIHARLEGGVCVLFRYYDPRITRLWLQHLPAGERDRLMGPMNLIRLPDGVLQREGAAFPGVCYTHTPWLTLDVQQVQRLSEAAREAVLVGVIEQCQQYFPACMQGLDATGQRLWATQCCCNAERQGYSAMDEVMRWVSLYAHFGESFPDGFGHGRYREILSAREQLPKERLDNLLTELKRQIALGEVTS